MPAQFFRAQAFGLSLLVGVMVASFSRATDVGGLLSNNTVWTASQSPYFVLTNVAVPNGLTLTVQAGVVVRMSNGVSITAQGGATIEVEGTAPGPVQFLPMIGNNNWGTINASGTNSFITVRHAEIARGGLTCGRQSTGLVEDSYVHDLTSPLTANSAKFVTVRRIHVNIYNSCVFNSGTIVLAEDLLFENMTIANGDALEIQNGPPGSVIRRCTFRHSTGSNSDAVDCSGSTSVFVHDCLIYDFTDKGFSFGTATAFNQPASLAWS